MIKKKLLTIPLACAFALSFSACDGDNTVSVSEKTAPGPETPADSSADSTQNATEVKLLVDDFEDGDNQSPLGEFWYVYNDAGSSAESTIETVTKDSEGHPAPTKSDNGSKFSFNVKYTLKKGGYEYDAYVGWGVAMPQGEDYSKYSAVQYRYKGGSHCIHIEISDITDSDHYSSCPSTSKEWTTVTVKFAEMKQEGWGAAKAFNAAHINKVSFQAKGPDTQDSVFVDDIYLIGGSGADNGGSNNNEPPKAEENKPDIVPKDAVIPKVTFYQLA